MSGEPTTPDPEHAFDPAKQASMEEAIKNLSPDEARFFLWKLEQSLRKRKIMLSGYLLAMALWAIGMIASLVYVGMSSGFVGWVFLLPFAAVGGTLWAFGRWANKVGTAPPPADLVAKR